MRDVIKLGLRLLLFTLVGGLLLALTNALTEGPIAAHRTEVASAARRVVLPEAESFEPMEKSEPEAYPAVTDVMRALRADGSDAGFAFTLAPVGYNDAIYMTLGVNAAGSVTRLTIDGQSETVGMGTRVTDGDFLDQFTGIAASVNAVDRAVDTISGATVSSVAVKNGVRQAMALAEELGVTPSADPSLKDVAPLTSKDDDLKSILPNLTGISELSPYVLLGDYRDITRVRRAVLAGGISAYIIDVSPNGFGGHIDMRVVIGSDGNITSVDILAHKETADRAAATVGSLDYMDQFQGIAADEAAINGVDSVSSATVTSNALKLGLTEAARFYHAFLATGAMEGGAAQ